MGKYYYNHESTNIIRCYFNNNKILKVYKGNELVWDFMLIPYDWVMLTSNIHNKVNLYINNNNNEGVKVNVKNSKYSIYTIGGYDSTTDLYTQANGIYLNKYSENLFYANSKVNLNYLNFEFTENLDYAFYNCKNITGNSYKSGPRTKSMVYTYYSAGIIGNAACGENVTNLSHCYENSLVKGEAVCGSNVIDMSFAYSNTSINEPVCSKNVENMASAYRNCKSITEYGVCGKKVTNMSRAYYASKVKYPECGNNVIDLSWTYAHTNVKNPVCGKKVENMHSAYYNCNINIAVCGNNVIDFSFAYYNSKVVTPKCGPNVIDMSSAYYNCNCNTYNCGSNVIDMSYAYYNCHGIRAKINIGPKVENLSYAYYKALIRGELDFFNNSSIKDMSYAFTYCGNELYPLNAISGPNVINMNNTYSQTYLNNAEIGINTIDADHCFYNAKGDFTLNVDPNCKVEIMNRCFWNSNLNGPTFCGNNVTELEYTYYNCKKITTFACGSNVINMINTYQSATACSGNIVISNSVINCYGAYRNCKLSQYVYLGENIEEAFETFYDCTGLLSVFGDFKKIINMDYTFYDCQKLKEFPIISSNQLRSIHGAFFECNNIGGNFYIPNSVCIIKNAFHNCRNNRKNIYFPKNIENLTSLSADSLNCLHETTNYNIYFYNGQYQFFMNTTPSRTSGDKFNLKYLWMGRTNLTFTYNTTEQKWYNSSHNSWIDIIEE